jgi:hypothetical protein
VTRAESGRVIAVKGSLVSGFVRLGRFYTRDEAAAGVLETVPYAAARGREGASNRWAVA